MAPSKKQQPFRFLELPAELRNRIYSELLTYTIDRSVVVQTAILSTCQQIHGEAESILYQTMSVDLSITTTVNIDQTSVLALETDAAFGRKDLQVPRNDEQQSSLVNDIELFPAAVLKVQTLALRIDIDEDDTGALAVPDDRFARANHVLYALASLLAESKKLRTVEGTVKITGTAIPGAVILPSQILYPLVKFERMESVQLSFTGGNLGSDDHWQIVRDAKRVPEEPVSCIRLFSELTDIVEDTRLYAETAMARNYLLDVLLMCDHAILSMIDRSEYFGLAADVNICRFVKSLQELVRDERVAAMLRQLPIDAQLMGELEESLE